MASDREKERVWYGLPYGIQFDAHPREMEEESTQSKPMCLSPWMDRGLSVNTRDGTAQALGRNLFGEAGMFARGAQSRVVRCGASPFWLLQGLGAILRG